ncbi:drug resistance transporter, EmrB/QacA subfamily [Jatrophihabitans endophyticus]|uniref:Drug resistance transporter, EmrB/QacA subfamily n=1 Tax=Jatrophihabitans endophyticus TaxID=1206085 RepID=A0A1M5IHI7_9ACTN|nr:MFS transporter [Jatrophihabitans endophyticus]SHG27721.1 drug resistance transporter, EmrB/QacA subfamily [Jatrophihabitans endophyticus]
MSDQTHTSHDTAQDPHRWLILAVVGVAQLMVVLDATIVNIALPSAQRDLGFSIDDRQWVVSSYAIAFGALLLLGGRLGDLFGRRRLLVLGLIGFAGASAVGGAAGNFETLIAARIAQGVFGALLAPAALATVATSFTNPAERGKAFGIFSAIAGVGAGAGLLLGGVLTDLLSWRWCLYVNIVFALVAVVGTRVMKGDDSGVSRHRVLDLPGAVTATGGLFLLVFGVSRAETSGWGSASTIAFLVAGAALLVVFALVERRSSHPLLPPRVVADPARTGSYFAIAMLGVTIFGVFLFLTFYLQQNLDYSPLKSGLAFMPLNLTILAVSGVTATQLLPKVGPRILISAGLMFAAVAAVLLAQLDTSSGYVGGVLPALFAAGIGAGFLFPTTFAAGTAGVDRHDAGVASAMVNTAQQVGGSVGIAFLSTIFADSLKDTFAENPRTNPAGAAIDGYTTVFWWAAAISAAAAVIAFVLVRNSPAADGSSDAEPASPAAMH